jgi:hypothetical protein
VIDDLHRLNDLQNMLKRMGAVSAVFRVRSETIGAPGFLTFSELMDAYIELCRRNVLARTDYVKEALAVDDQARTEVTQAFTKVFGQDPAHFLKSAPTKPDGQ